MTRQIELKVERSAEQPSAEEAGELGQVLMTPALSPDYWQYRVMLTETQAVLGFWKFGMIGVGFAVENGSWNTNLPHCEDADRLFSHIEINKGEDQIPDEDVIEAIRLIDQAVRADGECGCRTCVEGE